MSTCYEKLDISLKNHIEILLQRYPVLMSVKQDILEAYCIMEDCYSNNGKILIAGNGGSAADAEHIVGELMKGFRYKRRLPKQICEEIKRVNEDLGSELEDKLQGALPAIALNNHTALNSAYLNDVDGILGYAQQVNGYGNKGDVLLAISTSGNSKNILYASVLAKVKHMKIVGLTGHNGGKLNDFTDVTICVPESETYMIQELHLPVYHCLCLMLEEKFFNIDSKE